MRFQSFSDVTTLYFFIEGTSVDQEPSSAGAASGSGSSQPQQQQLPVIAQQHLNPPLQVQGQALLAQNLPQQQHHQAAPSAPLPVLPVAAQAGAYTSQTLCNNLNGILAHTLHTFVS